MSSGPLTIDQIEPLDGGWGWMIVFASYMVHAIADGVLYSFGVFYEGLLLNFNNSRAETSWIVSMMVGLAFITGPLSSALTNAYGCRVVTVLGAVIAMIGLSSTVVVPSPQYFYLTIGLIAGCGFGLMGVPAIVSVSCYFEKKRGLATSIAVSGSGLGTFALAPVEEWLISYYGWHGALLIVSGIVLNCAVFGLLYSPPVSNRKPKKVPETPQVAPETADVHQSTDDGMKLTLRQRGTSVLDVSEAFEYIGTSDGSYHSDLNVRSEPVHRMPPLELSHRASLSEQPQTTRKRSHVHRGLMNFEDILFTGDVTSLSERDSSRRRPEIGATGDVPGKQKTIFGEASNILRRMMDGNILRDCRFLMFLACHFFISGGFNIPYIFILDRVKDLHLAVNQNASLLISILGILNTFGRLASGFIADSPSVNKLRLYIGCLMICGLSTAVSVYTTEYYMVAVYCALFGLCAGICISLTSIIIVEIFGLHKLTNAFGLLMLVVGAGSFIGPPITGFLYDKTGSYDPGFIFSGTIVTVGSAMLIFVPKMPS